jgi:peptidoglycan hydrolase CwlO-like protein
MEGVKLEIVIAETNIQRQVSSMQKQVTKIQEDFAAIRNENIELMSQIQPC